MFINYFSTNLNHDSLYVIECINDLLYKCINGRFTKCNFWSDNAGHFRSSELLHHLLVSVPIINTNGYNIDVTVNYFNEYHGKSKVDSHFGYLQRTYNFIDKTRRIGSINQLVEMFQDQCIKKKLSNVYSRIYTRERRPGLISKLKVTDFKTYLSFKIIGNNVCTSGISTDDMRYYREVAHNHGQLG